jgi:hypothetical protein
VAHKEFSSTPAGHDFGLGQRHSRALAAGSHSRLLGQQPSMLTPFADISTARRSA